MDNKFASIQINFRDTESADKELMEREGFQMTEGNELQYFKSSVNNVEDITRVMDALSDKCFYIVFRLEDMTNAIDIVKVMESNEFRFFTFKANKKELYKSYSNMNSTLKDLFDRVIYIPEAHMNVMKIFEEPLQEFIFGLYPAGFIINPEIMNQIIDHINTPEVHCHEFVIIYSRG